MSDKTIIFIVIASISVIVFIWNAIKIESGCYSIPEKIEKQEDFIEELSDIVWGSISIIGVFILLAISILKLF